MNCRCCGACCTEISISTIIPGLGRGKRAGERCPHLTDNNLCELFNKPERPEICSTYLPDPEICGENVTEAIDNLRKWEELTDPT